MMAPNDEQLEQRTLEARLKTPWVARRYAVALRLLLRVVELHDVGVPQRGVGADALRGVELQAHAQQVQRLDRRLRAGGWFSGELLTPFLSILSSGGPEGAYRCGRKCKTDLVD